jgi:hypothetical protein
MIDINKFKNLANEIIANSTKNEMQSWFESYRTNKATFKNKLNEKRLKLRIL